MHSGVALGLRPPRSRVPSSMCSADTFDGWVQQLDAKVWFGIKDIMLPCFDGVWTDEVGQDQKLYPPPQPKAPGPHRQQ
eukprot:1471673-Amphidinium_carterae.1